VLAASLAFSAASAYYFSNQVRQEARSRFETVAIGVANDVQSRIRAYGDVLYALRGLFDSSDEVTRDEFHQFAQALSLSERYPGVTNISFSLRVPLRKKLDFERAVRAERSPCHGAAGIRHQAPGERPEYMVLSYLEPMGKNVVAWGSISTPIRCAARPSIARATPGEYLELGSDPDKGQQRQRNKHAVAARHVPRRRRAGLGRGAAAPLLGLVGSTLRVNEMIDTTLSKEILSRAQLQIYEVGGEGAAKDTLLFDSAAPAPRPLQPRRPNSPDTR